MGRSARLLIGLVVPVLLLGPGCSAGDKAAGPQGPTSTTTGPSSADTTPAGGNTDTTPASSDDPGATEPPPAVGPATTTAAPGAGGGGWRLAITHPTAGSSVGRVALLCYEVTGPSPQAAIALDVAINDGTPIRVAGSVGRGSVHVDLARAEYDAQSIRVQLIVNGQRLDGAAVTILGVLVVPAAADPACP